MKATIQIIRPGMALACDEVGCNLTMENIGCSGKERYITSVENQAYWSTATKNCHLTCLCITQYDGEPLLCVVLIKDKKKDLFTEVGIDTAYLNEVNGDVVNENKFVFLTKKGDNKLFQVDQNADIKGKKYQLLPNA